MHIASAAPAPPIQARFQARFDAWAEAERGRFALWLPVAATAGVVGYFALSREPALCSGPAVADIRAALDDAPDAAWTIVGDASRPAGLAAVADLMASVTAKDGIVAIFQGPAETGPRALGHRSIVANPCNPHIRCAFDTIDDRFSATI